MTNTTEEIKHIQVNGRYKVQFERGATKGIDGFRVEANGDNMMDTVTEAERLYAIAQGVTAPADPTPTAPVEVKTATPASNK